MSNYPIVFTEKGIQQGDLLMPWNEVKGLFYSWLIGTPVIRGSTGQKIKLDKSDHELKQILINFFEKWRQQFPDLARKNAFDYSEPKSSGAILLITISVLFCTFLGFILIYESYVQHECSNYLNASAVISEPQILKLKKRQQGNYSVKLRFDTPLGLIEGERLTTQIYPVGAKDPKDFTVLYAEHRPSCWVLAEATKENAGVNWARRRYTILFDLLVGSSFLLVGIIGLTVNVIRLRNKVPYSKEIADLFQLD